MQVRDVSDLEGVLRGRGAPSSAQAARLSSMATKDRRAELARLNALEHRVRDALTQPAKSSQSAGSLLRELDISAIPDDNDWRGILSAIRAMSPPEEAIDRVALTQFMAYLVGTRECIAAIEGPANTRPRPGPGTSRNDFRRRTRTPPTAYVQLEPSGRPAGGTGERIVFG